MTFVVASFYHFFDFPDYASRRAELLALLQAQQIKGSILIAAEGFNGTVSGRRDAIDAALAYLQTLGGAFEYKESFHDVQPFGKAKVRLKKELISLGEKTPSLTLPRSAGEGISCSLSPKGGELGRGSVGDYVEPRDWNALIADPDTLVLDTRNAYETHLGMFARAVDPKTKNFKELPAFVRKNLGHAKRQKIAAYCTGGIRCEKFTAWLKGQGFENVYHLRGGILKYLEEIPESESLWQGECFVFDERVAVGHGLAPSATAGMCKACGHALTEKDRQDTLYSEGKQCRFCAR
jgi:UPF0176 protein